MEKRPSQDKMPLRPQKRKKASKQYEAKTTKENGTLELTGNQYMSMQA
jgi:hypothetical protein